MSKLKQHVEFLANVAIIVVAVALCAVLVRQYLFAGAATQTPQPAVGAKINLPGVDLSAQDKTLLLVLQKGCHYCSESAPFYQRLAREAADRVRLVAVLPQAVEEGRGYLSELGVPALDVRQAKLGSLEVGGTPTLIMLNRGTVTDVWVGKLDAAEESQVLSKL
jgi:thiol-disulfide isomerase/thioredoxin